MARYFRWGLIVCAAALLALPAQAQEKQKPKKRAHKPAAAEVAAPAEAAATPSLPTPVPENTVDFCQDQLDNDADGHVDCVDQDCEIYAICVRPAMLAPPLPPPPPALVAPAPPLPPPPPAEERGSMCTDGIDNDRDGLTDCYEKVCQKSRRCRREIYYVPEPENKAPGLLVSFGGGLAVPNFRGNDTKGHSDIYGDVPFHPDFGGIVSLSVGVLPVKFFGVGVNLIAGGTFGSNRQDWDNENHVFDDPYKYDATKGFGHVGGYVRFQWPFDRFVPYLQLSGGYTYAKERWWIYDRDEAWTNINEGDEQSLDGMQDYDERSYRHFTAAVEPGFDVFVRKRSFAVGLRAWMPVWATSHPGVDNVGVMLNFAFTPMWREKPAMKPEYADPASTLEEETAELPLEPPAEPPPAPAPATEGAVVGAAPATAAEATDVAAEPAPAPAPLEAAAPPEATLIEDPYATP